MEREDVRVNTLSPATRAALGIAAEDRVVFLPNGNALVHRAGDLTTGFQVDCESFRCPSCGSKEPNQRCKECGD